MIWSDNKQNKEETLKYERNSISAFLKIILQRKLCCVFSFILLLEISDLLLNLNIKLAAK
jgi:hypothetical protein